ncbi:MAG: potassium channel family protein [Candidatus Dormibacteraeota bacterium]|nr:potassium channel family protein [Candidatus Dormibacteraeota bacterium]
MLQMVEAAVGIVILAVAFYDVFQSVVLPRPSIGKLRLAPWILRPLWAAWRWLGTRDSRIDRRENWLGTFGPVALIALLGFWSLSIILGFALIIDSIPNQIQPSPADFWVSLFFSASTLLPLSYGDILPVGALIRVVILAESATGLGLIALVISLLFSLYGSFQRREELVVTLDALAGAPPAGLQILETVASHRMPDELRATFDDWRRWSAAVLESHLAYPILVYFRSSHDNEAWLNSFGAVMDAATLVLSTVVSEDATEGHARLMFKVGNHLVEDLAWYFRFKNDAVPIVERQEFDDARERLIKAGFRCRESDVAWSEFASLRSMYASPLNQLAGRLAILPAKWIGDRSYLPHARRDPARSRRPRRGRQSDA